MAEEKKAPAPAAAKKEKDENARRPTALKRDIQSRKRELRNRAFHSSVRTAVRALETSLSQKDAPESIKTKLQSVYSLMDKGVKKKIYKPQKAARTKSRLTARCNRPG